MIIINDKYHLMFDKAYQDWDLWCTKCKSKGGKYSGLVASMGNKFNDPLDRKCDTCKVSADAETIKKVKFIMQNV